MKDAEGERERGSRKGRGDRETRHKRSKYQGKNAHKPHSLERGAGSEG